MLAKDEAEHPIPNRWRTTFRGLVDAFVAGDFQLREHDLNDVAPIDAAAAKRIAENVAAYGEALAPLDDATWATSVYCWQDGYWQMLVDLSTVSKPVSDLTLHALLRAADVSRLEIDSVHVP